MVQTNTVRLGVFIAEARHVEFIDSNNGKAIATYAGHAGSIQSLAYVSSQGIFSGSVDKTAAVWELNPKWRLERTIGSIDDPTALVAAMRDAGRARIAP